MLNPNLINDAINIEIQRIECLRNKMHDMAPCPVSPYNDLIESLIAEMNDYKNKIKEVQKSIDFY